MKLLKVYIQHGFPVQSMVFQSPKDALNPPSCSGSDFASCFKKGPTQTMSQTHESHEKIPVNATATNPKAEYLWWEKGIIYQIYPRSFQDSNGDGVGDLQGIIQRLEYLSWLGVDAIWLSPIFKSPMADFGYDIADYCAVDPIFGTIEDFDLLIKKAHALNLRIILDFVPNHTSDQHAWFQESRSSRDSPKRDWYIWKDPNPDGSPPNNWLSVFGGSAWELDEHTGQYYYHGFLKQQPDLNWRNPEVIDAMEAVLRYWLDRGVDGFRVDVLWHIIKDDQWRDNPINLGFKKDSQPSYDQLDPIYSTDRPEVHALVQQIRSIIDSYGHDKLFIGEIYLPVERLMAYYGPSANGTNMPYNFQLAHLPWRSKPIMEAVDTYESHLPEGAWPNWVLGNHDQTRTASRLQPHQVRGAQLLLLTLRGTPTMYYGDEIGMLDVPIAPHQVRDPFEIREPGIGNGRDPQRAPMPWDSTHMGDFTDGDATWLPMGDNLACNVEVQKNDENSLLNMIRELIQLRRQHKALSVGSHQPVPAKEPIAAYCRHYELEALYIIINFANENIEYPLPDKTIPVIFSTSTERKSTDTVSRAIQLGPGEGVILMLKTDDIGNLSIG